MTTASKAIGVVILSVAAAVIWRVKPRVASRLEPKQISTPAVEETKESESEPSDPGYYSPTFTDISPPLSSRPRMVLLWLGHVIAFCITLVLSSLRPSLMALFYISTLPVS
jgi:hypothetical protein